MGLRPHNKRDRGNPQRRDNKRFRAKLQSRRRVGRGRRGHQHAGQGPRGRVRRRRRLLGLRVAAVGALVPDAAVDAGEADGRVRGQVHDPPQRLRWRRPSNGHLLRRLLSHDRDVRQEAGAARQVQHAGAERGGGWRLRNAAEDDQEGGVRESGVEAGQDAGLRADRGDGLGGDFREPHTQPDRPVVFGRGAVEPRRRHCGLFRLMLRLDTLNNDYYGLCMSVAYVV